MGQQLAEVAERISGGGQRNDVPVLTHTEALNLLKYDYKASSHVTVIKPVLQQQSKSLNSWVLME